MAIDINLLPETGDREEWEWSCPNRIKIENGKIIADITCGFEKYYPFDYFKFTSEILKPTKKALEKNKRERQDILIEFISIDISKNDSISNFVKSYGFLKTDISKDTVIEFSEDINGNPISYDNFPQIAQHFKDQIDKGKEDLSEFISEVRYFQLLVETFNKLSRKDRSGRVNFELFKELARFGEICSPSKPYWSAYFIHELEKETKEEVESFEQYEMTDLLFRAIEIELQERIQNVVIFPYLIKNQFIESWYADNLLSALYYMLFIAIRDEKDIRKCENKSCSNYFFIYGSDYRKKYCNELCARAEASRRYRKKNKQNKDLLSPLSHKKESQIRDS